jgi:hypothetical protein
MKRCPVCGTTYTDVTLRYCLADGAALGGSLSEEPTLVSRDPLRVDIGRPTDPAVAPPTSVENKPPGGGGSLIIKILLALVGLGVLVVILVAAVAGFLYFNRDAGNGPGVTITNKVPSSTPTPAQTNSDDELQRQIANLERVLNEQLKNLPANLDLDLPDDDSPTREARVNSPGDGFLALRTFPSSETGERILQIPHGATVSVGGCLSGNKVKSKPGRWCRASYNGYSGWVYDGYLIY